MSELNSARHCNICSVCIKLTQLLSIECFGVAAAQYTQDSSVLMLNQHFLIPADLGKVKMHDILSYLLLARAEHKLLSK